MSFLVSMIKDKGLSCLFNTIYNCNKNMGWLLIDGNDLNINSVITLNRLFKSNTQIKELYLSCIVNIILCKS